MINLDIEMGETFNNLDEIQERFDDDLGFGNSGQVIH